MPSLSVSAAAETEKANGPRSRKGVRTRARLLEAAKAVFERDGFLEARISDIAKEAGLSHGSFYHYFDSKEEIFREVAEEVEDRLSAPMSVIVDPDSRATPQERIREALHRYIDNYRREAKIMGVIEEVSRYDEQVGRLRMERHKRYTQTVADSIRRLQEHGLGDPGLDPKVAAYVLGSMTVRFMELWLVQGWVNCSVEKATEQLSRAFINGLGLEA